MKGSFTLLELLITIAIISILGVVAFKFQDSSLVVARDQIVQHIRYTQSLALSENFYQHKPASSSPKDINSSKFWFKRNWQFYLTTSANTIYYSIFSDNPTDSNTTNFDKSPRFRDEVAIDPDSRKYLTGIWQELNGYSIFRRSEVNTKLNLSYSYGIDRVEANRTFGERWGVNRIRLIFDNFGRPYYFHIRGDGGDIHPFKYLLTESVQIKISKDGQSICFNIAPITGYIYFPGKCNF